MNKFFENMLPYEIILSVMGIIIFLVLIFLMIWMVLKKRSIALLLPFFLISIVMVAFPTLSSVKVGDFIIEITKQTRIVSNNPSDSLAVRNLIISLNQLNNNKKLSNNSDALIAAANAEIALGQYDSASDYLKKGEALNPESEGINSAKDLLNEKIKEKDNFIKNINILNSAISRLNESPSDIRAVRRMEETLSELKAPDYVNADEVLTIARSYAIIGHQEQSLQLVDKIEPSTEKEKRDITNLKDSVENNIFRKELTTHTQESVNQEAIRPVKTDLLERTVIRRVQR